MPFRVVASSPARSFVENVAAGPDGAMFVTVHSDNRIDRFNSKTGKTSVVAESPPRRWVWRSISRARFG
jgi:hypothetical protein